MTNDAILDLIIIGGGPGGLTSGIYAKRAALNTMLIEKGAPGGQMNNSGGGNARMREMLNAM